MKKTVKLLSLVLAICLLLTVFVACNKDYSSSKPIEETPEEMKLDTPNISYTIEEGTAFVSWTTNGNAENYGYIVNGAAEVITQTAFLELQVGDTIKVKAYAREDVVEIDGKKYCYKDSEYSKLETIALEGQKVIYVA